MPTGGTTEPPGYSARRRRYARRSASALRLKTRQITIDVWRRRGAGWETLTFQPAWAEGRAMTLEQAIEYALKSDS